MGTSLQIGVDPTERTQLVTTGPFALVRNPIFAAMLPTALGLTLLVPSWIAIGRSGGSHRRVGATGSSGRESHTFCKLMAALTPRQSAASFPALAG
jgi:hypothetical protein